jgi:hypothetical protein
MLALSVCRTLQPRDPLENIMLAPVTLLDPLRLVHGTGSDRYDCPDLAALDRHIDHLRRRIARLGGQVPDVAEACRADIDRLLDHRSWLTLPTLRRSAA